jgi:hypothetical protein
VTIISTAVRPQFKYRTERNVWDQRGRLHYCVILVFSFGIITEIKANTMRCAGHLERVGAMRIPYRREPVGRTWTGLTRQRIAVSGWRMNLRSCVTEWRNVSGTLVRVVRWAWLAAYRLLNVVIVVLQMAEILQQLFVRIADCCVRLEAYMFSGLHRVRRVTLRTAKMIQRLVTVPF